MDFVVTWSPQVRDDLNDIAAYIAKGSPRYASAVVSEILAAGRSLALFPRRGRVVPELGDEKCREVFVYEYRIIYRIEGRGVQVVAVIHGRQLLGSRQV
jgi:toxin ParE1/3/4